MNFLFVIEEALLIVVMDNDLSQPTKYIRGLSRELGYLVGLLVSIYIRDCDSTLYVGCGLIQTSMRMGPLFFFPSGCDRLGVRSFRSATTNSVALM